MTRFVAIGLFAMIWSLRLVGGSPAAARAQYPNVQVSLPGSNAPEEVTIAINPLNPYELVAGANLSYVWYSLDGGDHWVQQTLTSTFGVAGDPAVTFDADGNVYYAHLSYPPGGDWLDRIVVQKSGNGGDTWDLGVGVGNSPPKDQDKAWIAADLTDSPYHNALYLAWTEFDLYSSADPADSTRILFSRSMDGGATWSLPIRVSDAGGNAVDSDDTVEGAVPAVGPQGQVYVAWAGPGGLYFDRSLDGGQTFGPDGFVTTQPGGWDFAVSGIYRANGLPITACDTSSGPYRGRVYVLWSDQRHGVDDTDVFLVHSDDGGASWSPIVRVNDDRGPAQQFFPWLAIDPTDGFLYVVFYDRRATTGDDTDVFLAESMDGGESFHNFRVSESSFTPTAGVFFGDYINVAAYGGEVHPIWMRMDGGVLSVWTASVPVPTTAPLARADRAPAILHANIPNPFNPSTLLRYSLSRPAPVELSIFDARGRRIRTLVAGPQEAGEHEIRWFGRDDKGQPVASGVYSCWLRSGDTQQSISMVLLK